MMDEGDFFEASVTASIEDSEHREKLLIAKTLPRAQYSSWVNKIKRARHILHSKGHKNRETILLGVRKP